MITGIWLKINTVRNKNVESCILCAGLEKYREGERRDTYCLSSPIDLCKDLLNSRVARYFMNKTNRRKTKTFSYFYPPILLFFCLRIGVLVLEKKFKSHLRKIESYRTRKCVCQETYGDNTNNNIVTTYFIYYIRLFLYPEFVK